VGIWSRFYWQNDKHTDTDLLHLSRRKKAERLSIGSREGEGKIVVAVDSTRFRREHQACIGT